MVRFAVLALLVGAALAKKQCIVPEDTKGADDGNPHCWTRARRCDGPNAHPAGGPGYQPACGVCEGVGGIPLADQADKITIPHCTPIKVGTDEPAPKTPKWGAKNGGKFTVKNDRFTMIGKKTDPFCFKFFPSNNSVGTQCYRRQTGTLYYDMTKPNEAIRYDLNIHIPWPSDKFSLFGNISTTIFHHGPNMWIINNLYGLVKQVICTQPLSSAGHGSHNPDPIFPVMYNWTNRFNYWGREELEVEYGVGKMQLEHWNYGPHHAWTAVGDDTIVRMWQPYNGFEVFAPGSFMDGVADPAKFEGMYPPALSKKGGALMRIGCTDAGYPKNKTSVEKSASTADLKRARSKVPQNTHKGAGFADMSKKLNGFLKGYRSTKECSEWSAKELKHFQALMLMLKAPELDEVYGKTSDRRQLRGDEQEHGDRWERLEQLASKMGSEFETMHRDGHCHEAVMWFTHHLPETARQSLAAVADIPLLPYAGHQCSTGLPDEKTLCDEYLHQVSCQDCHQHATAPTNLVV